VYAIELPPVDYWKTILNSGPSEGAQWFLAFCNAIWSQKVVPRKWHLQQVTMIYKKGDPADCNNYRPICLLAAAYKLFAMILLKRLLSAGADARIWPTQYGFRKHRSTEDALRCVGRALELAWSKKNASLHFLALDWAKAFDSISPDGLLQSLRMFGIPDPFIAMVAAIYEDRVFQVRECGVTSDRRCQHSGICQGCPLSPFLFIIVMSIMMDIARKKLDPQANQAAAEHKLYEILYADDTIIIGVNPAQV
jgi:hypothetical protein